jgi:catechol 2,3-dioxygenase-like lactoylglutathione lyase family enzyme
MFLLHKGWREEGDMNVEEISAITIKVNDMAMSVHIYNRLLGLEVLYGGENAHFSSLKTLGSKDTILNLQKGHVTPKSATFVHYLDELSREPGTDLAFLEVEHKQV